VEICQHAAKSPDQSVHKIFKNTVSLSFQKDAIPLVNVPPMVNKEKGGTERGGCPGKREYKQESSSLRLLLKLIISLHVVGS
jgi:hypothetical protein